MWLSDLFLYCCPLSRSASRAWAGLVERHQGWCKESPLPGLPAASAHWAPQARSQPPTFVSELHDLSEGEQIMHCTLRQALITEPCREKLRLLRRNQLFLTYEEKKLIGVALFVCLQEEDEFRDKLTPISLALNYSLAPPSHDQTLPPVLNQYSSTFLQEQVDICPVLCPHCLLDQRAADMILLRQSPSAKQRHWALHAAAKRADGLKWLLLLKVRGQHFQLHIWEMVISSYDEHSSH